MQNRENLLEDCDPQILVFSKLQTIVNFVFLFIFLKDYKTFGNIRDLKYTDLPNRIFLKNNTFQ